MTTRETIVVKVGTSSVTTTEGAVDHEVLAALAEDVAQVRAGGSRVAVVTSGAITAGWADVGEGQRRPSDALTLQALSAVGQPLLMDAWRRAFAPHALTVGQVLLAPLDFAHRGQYLHARATITALFTLGVVPIINENDAVADEEIRFGDNDRLAALVANLIAASRLVLLTDTPGLLTADPHLDPNASLIEEVDRDRSRSRIVGGREQLRRRQWGHGLQTRRGENRELVRRRGRHRVRARTRASTHGARSNAGCGHALSPPRGAFVGEEGVDCLRGTVSWHAHGQRGGRSCTRGGRPQPPQGGRPTC